MVFYIATLNIIYITLHPWTLKKLTNLLYIYSILPELSHVCNYFAFNHQQIKTIVNNLKPIYILTSCFTGHNYKINARIWTYLPKVPHCVFFYFISSWHSFPSFNFFTLLLLHSIVLVVSYRYFHIKWEEDEEERKKLNGTPHIRQFIHGK